MIELTTGQHCPPLLVESRLLTAPGVWTPDSPLRPDGAGAQVTPPLGWTWEGEPQPWCDSPAGAVGVMARRPVDRYLRRVARAGNPLPLIVTLAPDELAPLRQAAALAESAGAAALLLWEATPAALRALRQSVPLLPLLAEVPCTALANGVAPWVEAGADALWIGAPRVEGAARLWGPAAFPLVQAALPAVAGAIPCVVGAAIHSAASARAVLDGGARAIALDPTWWVRPSLWDEVQAALA